jgi:two-component system sensor histidine kinase CreC
VVTIRRRLLGTLLVAVGASFALLAAVLITGLRTDPLWSEETVLREKAAALAFRVLDDAREAPSVHTDREGALYRAITQILAGEGEGLGLQREELKVTVTDDRGRIIFDSEGPAYGDSLVRHEETAALTVSVPLFLMGAPAGKLFLSKGRPSAAGMDRRRERLIVVAVAIAAAAAFLAAALAVLLATRPLFALLRFARELEEGDEASPPASIGGELGAVARRLEEGRKSVDGTQYVEKYVQTLTHEMKSPLSVLRGASELLEEEMSDEQRAVFVGNIRKETERIQDLVDRLLQLSAIEGRRELRDVEHIVLAPLVREVADGLEPLMTSKEIVPDLDLEPSAAVWGEHFLLRQALANILKNAVEFSPVGGALGLRLRSEDRQAVITVDDAGPGVPDYALSRVFEKFYSLGRPDTGRRSSGLGLPFARETALLHGGEITIENMAGGGVRVRLALPLDPDSSRATLS